jgi:subtilisin family serine protease
VIAVLALLAVPALAAPKVALPDRGTWDADMINSAGTGYTGDGVYVAVLDTGLVPNWRDYFPVERIATDLGRGFKEEITANPLTGNRAFAGSVHETSWVGSAGDTHGTHVASTIIGYKYYTPGDAAAGFPLAPLYIEGIAPGATIIPVKVLADYVAPGAVEGNRLNIGTEKMIAAGIDYATDLKLQGYSPMIISMSLGGPDDEAEINTAIDRAIENGVIVVACAGNEGADGMDWPGAYSPVISVGANGWTYEWYRPGPTAPLPRYRFWWLQDATYGFNDVPEPTPADDVYITDWSAREKAGQQLDVVAPGSYVRGPYPSGYAHLPWWSAGQGWAHSAPGLTNFFYAAGTSMATPHVSAVAAQMLEKNPALTQADVESILKNTALNIAPGSRTVWDVSVSPQDWCTYSWDTDATGAGLVQADAAVAAS